MMSVDAKLARHWLETLDERAVEKIVEDLILKACSQKRNSIVVSERTVVNNLNTKNPLTTFVQVLQDNGYKVNVIPLSPEKLIRIEW